MLLFVIASDRRERRNLVVKIIAEIAGPVPSPKLYKKEYRQKDEIASPPIKRGARNDVRGISLLAMTVFTNLGNTPIMEKGGIKDGQIIQTS